MRRTRLKASHRRRNGGFTLIELMIVIVILGILSTLVILNIAGAPDEARVTKAKTDIQTLQSALILFKVQNGFYPSTEQGIKALIEKPSTKPIPKNYPQGGYLNQQTVPKDPWGNDYIYRSPGENGRPIEIISLGADQMEGGSGFDADIKSYESKE